MRTTIRPSKSSYNQGWRDGSLGEEPTLQERGWGWDSQNTASHGGACLQYQHGGGKGRKVLGSCWSTNLNNQQEPEASKIPYLENRANREKLERKPNYDPLATPHTWAHIHEEVHIKTGARTHTKRVPITIQRSNEIVTPRFLTRETKTIRHHSYS